MELNHHDGIRERAYAIWAEQGRPDGVADAHWLQAEREMQGFWAALSASPRPTKDASPKPAAKPAARKRAPSKGAGKSKT